MKKSDADATSWRDYLRAKLLLIYGKDVRKPKIFRLNKTI